MKISNFLLAYYIVEARWILSKSFKLFRLAQSWEGNLWKRFF